MNTEKATVLVTGGSGFIGRHLCKLLVDQGYDVINIDRVKFDQPGVIQYPFDLASHQVDGVIKLTRPETIIHLAAEHEVGRSVQEPAVYYENNINNTINLLNAAAQAGVKNFIFSSSSSVYGNQDSYPVSEDAIKLPQSPYARTKSMVEDMLPDYEQAYGIRWLSLRYFNAVGAGYTQDPPAHIVPKLCEAAAKETIFEIYGNNYDTPDGTCLRDYTHVTDIAEAHLAGMRVLQESDVTSQSINLGANRPVSVLELIDMFNQVTGQNVTRDYMPNRAGDVVITHASNQRAFDILHWEPKHTLEQACAEAWQWHQSQKPSRRKKNAQ